MPELDWVVGCTYTGLPRERADVRNLMGCNMSFRREVFARVGGFDESAGRVGSIPLGCEETELCIRLGQRVRGARVVFDPAAEVRHRVTADRTTWRYLRRRCYAEGLSKALVTRSVGAADGLATERSYAAAVLPRGVLRGLRDGLRGDRAALARSGAIVTGLGATAWGYAVGRVQARRAPASPVAA